MPHRTLIEYLDRFRRFGSETAVIDRRGYRTIRTSYRHIAETAAQFARELEARGIERGERVLIWGENCAEWIAVFWGCLLRGAIAVPMDHIALSDFALRVCREADAKLAICSRERAPIFAQAGRAIPSLSLETLGEEVSRHGRSPYRSTCERTDTAEILFTSGATAEPKGVVISHGNLLANLDPLDAAIGEYRRYERLVHPLRFLNLLPLSHVFGQMMGIFIPPLIGGTVVFENSLNPSEIIRTIRRERISVLVAVPRLLESLKEKIERDLESEGRLDWFRREFEAAAKEKFYRRWWRFRRIHSRFGWEFWAFISGGATLDPRIETFWSRLGLVVIQGYGLTETTSLISLNHPFRASRGSIGQVLPGREIKLDESGEILVRGESIASGYMQGGYWQSSEMRPVPGEDGWFATGDLGELDDKGNLYFKGRKKNLIVTPEGLNIYPEDLEAALRRDPEVRDCVVVGIEREGREEPCAVLILRHGSEPPFDRLRAVSAVERRPEGSGQENSTDEAIAESIVQRTNRSLAEYQRMRRWFVWRADDFPRTSTQKPRINEIKEEIKDEIKKAMEPQKTGESLGASPSGASGASTNEASLAGLIERVTGRRPATLSADAGIETDLNLSSIERVELMSAIEDRYQVDLNETSFTAATTLGDLDRMLHQPIPQSRNYGYPRWAQRAPVALIRLVIYYLLVWPATVLLACPRVRGRTNLRGLRGPALVVSNHVTPIDIGWVLKALPWKVRHRIAVAMGGERLMGMRHPPAERGVFMSALDRLGYVLVVALFNVFPLPKLSGFRESFQFAGESVDRGYSVLVFPEGELTKDGKVGTFRAGIGILAAKLNVPIIPMRIDGLFELREARRKFAWPGAVKVIIGEPVHFDAETDPASIARELETRVSSL